MPSIPVGAQGRFELLVTDEHLANRFKDVLLPPVLILILENAALNALKPHLGPGFTALGTRVDVQHLMATPPGRLIRGEATVVAVDGRRIEFRVSARDGDEEIGRGTHERMIIDAARFRERLKSKYG